MPHQTGEVHTPAPIDVRGWITDEDRNPVRQAWLLMADFAAPLPLNQARPDVAKLVVLADQGATEVGFGTRIALPEIVPGRYEATVVARNADGDGLYAGWSQMVTVATSSTPVASRASFTNLPPLETCDIRDTGAMDADRRLLVVREETLLCITGRAAGARTLTVTAFRVGAPSGVGWTCAADDGGAFVGRLWTADLARGLYHLVITALDENGRAVAGSQAYVEVSGRVPLPARHLPPFITPSHGEVHDLVDAGIRPLDDPGTLVSGRPIAISGRCTDPVAGGRLTPIYAELDDGLVFLLHADEFGFGGILDTRELAAGEHRLRVFGLAATGNGWYVVEQRAFHLAPAAGREHATT